MIEGSREALFQRWLSDHLGIMLKVVRTCANNSADQDDLLQAILLNLWISLPKFRGDSKESTWVYRVAFNTALSWKRGEQRRLQKFEHLQLDLADFRSNRSAPDSDFIELLYDAIRHLSNVDASLAIMHLDGMTYVEMSEVLGISPNLVGVKLTRIRQELAQHLERLKDDV